MYFHYLCWGYPHAGTGKVPAIGLFPSNRPLNTNSISFFSGSNCTLLGSFMYEFSVEAVDAHSAARVGCLATPHGEIETPVFMPVGTQATVKALSPDELRGTGCRIILANAYHLNLRPGDELIRDAGGLHSFESWPHAMLTDSGGFQVFSLKDISRISDDGVTFQSHIDGSQRFFSPETVMAIEHNLGADIIMCFDECPPAKADREVLQKAVDRTIAWADRCLETHGRLGETHGYPQALFGIVQGGTDKKLREYCSAQLVRRDFPGYAVGGCAVGEAMEEMYDIVGFTAGLLPPAKPRYLMGVGLPQNMLESIERGIDMFDCVLPTRNGRNGCAFTSSGRVNIRNAQYTRDFDNPLDPGCTCYGCTRFSRAYVRHLYMAGELLSHRIISLHNVHFFVGLIAEARRRIRDGSFGSWKRETIERMTPANGT